MRKVTSDTLRAFGEGRPIARGNTTVAVDDDGTVALILHGNPIAKRDPSGHLCVRTAGWDTVTTKERLNGLDGVQVHHERRALYLNGQPWGNHAEWTEIAV